MQYTTFKRPRRKRVSAITGKLTALTEETELQIACTVYYDKRCRIDRDFREKTRFFAINPVPQKSANQAVLAKRMGLRAGIYDAVLHDLRSGVFVETWIEFKAKDGKLTDAQEDWFRWLANTPVRERECRTLDQFIGILG